MIETNSSTAINHFKQESVRFQGLNIEVAKVIVGQQDIIQFIVIAILCNGHILLEGVPGVAKTTIIKSITNALGLHFNRIQFTPDLLPADVVGTLIYNPRTQEFETKKGPIFANLILADEINRAPAKVQAALLEVMQERQVTIGSNTFKLEKPFLVFATQNPIEQEGTYRLPEAQLDRFMFKLVVDYPHRDQEKELLKRDLRAENITKVLQVQDLFAAQQLVENVYADERILDYIVNIIMATRMPSAANLKAIAPYIGYGVSPRATLALLHAAKAYAFLNGREFVIPDDVKKVAPAILRHRLILTYEAEADHIKPDMIIQTILNTVPSP